MPSRRPSKTAARAARSPTPGYSGKPLAQKLGIAAGTKVLVLEAPPDYATLVAPLPDGAALVTRPPKVVDFVHLFATRSKALAAHLQRLRRTLQPAGTVWVSWPKRSAGVDTDVTEDTIRELALPLGFVDVKVCAVSDVWSGLKLMVRKSERGG